MSFKAKQIPKIRFKEHCQAVYAQLFLEGHVKKYIFGFIAKNGSNKLRHPPFNRKLKQS
jgi:hypothetical protein